MATHSSILAWEIPWIEEPDGLWFMVSKESDMTEATQHACMGLGTATTTTFDCQRPQGQWLPGENLDSGH